MPSRNVIRYDIDESYYHVYARGTNKQPIFLNEDDFVYFQMLLDRYLGKAQRTSKEGVVYPNFYGKVELLAFCLMKNHFHLLVYQPSVGRLTKFMQSLMTSYSRYFNLKYRRTGSLFESRYKASRISDDQYLQHISRYIHLNPRYWKEYKYSSLHWYRKGAEPDWLHTKPILGLFPSRAYYMDFLADYEDQKEMLEEIKHELADN